MRMIEQIKIRQKSDMAGPGAVYGELSFFFFFYLYI